MHIAAQPDLFGAEPAPSYRPDPDRVRARLQGMLAVAKAARRMPWEPGRASLNRTVFPRMSRWLPEDEAARLCAEFEAEMTRLMEIGTVP